MAFQPLPLADIMTSVKVVLDEPEEVPLKEASQEPHPTFGPCPNTQVADFNFKKEVEHLPFRLNLRNLPLDREHQTKFIDLIYRNQEVFSLQDEDLDYCDQLTHTIPTSTDKPVYLPHSTIPRQLQVWCANVLRPGFTKGSFDLPTVPMHLKLLLSIKNWGDSSLCGL